MRWRVGVRVVLLLVKLAGLFELRQLALEHVGGGGHRRLRRQQRGDGRPLLRFVLASSNALMHTEGNVLFRTVARIVQEVPPRAQQ